MGIRQRASAAKKGKPFAGSTEERIPEWFEALAATLRKDGGVDAADSAPKRGFGAGALKVGGKIFAMPAQGTLVLKLPATRVDALAAAGRGERFDPGHGRVMKEWIALRGGEAQWTALAREARSFVKGT